MALKSYMHSFVCSLESIRSNKSLFKKQRKKRNIISIYIILLIYIYYIYIYIYKVPEYNNLLFKSYSNEFLLFSRIF